MSFANHFRADSVVNGLKRALFSSD